MAVLFLESIVPSEGIVAAISPIEQLIPLHTIIVMFYSRFFGTIQQRHFLERHKLLFTFSVTFIKAIMCELYRGLLTKSAIMVTKTGKFNKYLLKQSKSFTLQTMHNSKYRQYVQTDRHF